MQSCSGESGKERWEDKDGSWRVGGPGPKACVDKCGRDPCIRMASGGLPPSHQVAQASNSAIFVHMRKPVKEAAYVTPNYPL